jgi:hypothetical protein
MWTLTRRRFLNVALLPAVLGTLPARAVQGGEPHGVHMNIKALKVDRNDRFGKAREPEIVEESKKKVWGWKRS